MSWGDRNKIPQVGWLRSTKMYSLPTLEAPSLGSRCEQGRGGSPLLRPAFPWSCPQHFTWASGVTGPSRGLSHLPLPPRGGTRVRSRGEASCPLRVLNLITFFCESAFTGVRGVDTSRGSSRGGPCCQLCFRVRRYTRGVRSPRKPPCRSVSMLQL